jgi:hypothetical protein
LAPRLSAVVALWKGASAEQRWPITLSDRSKDENEQPRPPDAHRHAPTD